MGRLIMGRCDKRGGERIKNKYQQVIDLAPQKTVRMP
jgi:hypothetical protein